MRVINVGIFLFITKLKLLYMEKIVNFLNQFQPSLVSRVFRIAFFLLLFLSFSFSKTYNTKIEYDSFIRQGNLYIKASVFAFSSQGEVVEEKYLQGAEIKITVDGNEVGRIVTNNVENIEVVTPQGTSSVQRFFGEFSGSLSSNKCAEVVLSFKGTEVNGDVYLSSSSSFVECPLAAENPMLIALSNFLRSFVSNPLYIPLMLLFGLLVASLYTRGTAFFAILDLISPKFPLPKISYSSFWTYSPHTQARVALRRANRALERNFAIALRELGARGVGRTLSVDRAFTLLLERMRARRVVGNDILDRALRRWRGGNRGEAIEILRAHIPETPQNAGFSATLDLIAQHLANTAVLNAYGERKHLPEPLRSFARGFNREDILSTRQSSLIKRGLTESWWGISRSLKAMTTYLTPLVIFRATRRGREASRRIRRRALETLQERPPNQAQNQRVNMPLSRRIRERVRESVRRGVANLSLAIVGREEFSGARLIDPEVHARNKYYDLIYGVGSEALIIFTLERIAGGFENLLRTEEGRERLRRAFANDERALLILEGVRSGNISLQEAARELVSSLGIPTTQSHNPHHFLERVFFSLGVLNELSIDLGNEFARISRGLSNLENFKGTSEEEPDLTNLFIDIESLLSGEFRFFNREASIVLGALRTAMALENQAIQMRQQGGEGTGERRLLFMDRYERLYYSLRDSLNQAQSQGLELTFFLDRENIHQQTPLRDPFFLSFLKNLQYFAENGVLDVERAYAFTALELFNGYYGVYKSPEIFENVPKEVFSALVSGEEYVSHLREEINNYSQRANREEIARVKLALLMSRGENASFYLREENLEHFARLLGLEGEVNYERALSHLRRRASRLEENTLLELERLVDDDILGRELPQILALNRREFNSVLRAFRAPISEEFRSLGESLNERVKQEVMQSVFALRALMFLASNGNVEINLNTLRERGLGELIPEGVEGREVQTLLRTNLLNALLDTSIPLQTRLDIGRAVSGEFLENEVFNSHDRGERVFGIPIRMEWNYFSTPFTRDTFVTIRGTTGTAPFEGQYAKIRRTAMLEYLYNRFAGEKEFGLEDYEGFLSNIASAMLNVKGRNTWIDSSQHFNSLAYMINAFKAYALKEFGVNINDPVEVNFALTQHDSQELYNAMRSRNFSLSTDEVSEGSWFYIKEVGYVPFFSFEIFDLNMLPSPKAEKVFKEIESIKLRGEVGENDFKKMVNAIAQLASREFGVSSYLIPQSAHPIGIHYVVIENGISKPIAIENLSESPLAHKLLIERPQVREEFAEFFAEAALSNNPELIEILRSAFVEADVFLRYKGEGHLIEGEEAVQEIERRRAEVEERSRLLTSAVFEDNDFERVLQRVNARNVEEFFERLGITREDASRSLDILIRRLEREIEGRGIGERITSIFGDEERSIINRAREIRNKIEEEGLNSLNAREVAFIFRYSQVPPSNLEGVRNFGEALFSYALQTRDRELLSLIFRGLSISHYIILSTELYTNSRGGVRERLKEQLKNILHNWENSGFASAAACFAFELSEKAREYDFVYDLRNTIVGSAHQIKERLNRDLFHVSLPTSENSLINRFVNLELVRSLLYYYQRGKFATLDALGSFLFDGTMHVFGRELEGQRRILNAVELMKYTNYDILRKYETNRAYKEFMDSLERQRRVFADPLESLKVRADYSDEMLFDTAAVGRDVGLTFGAVDPGKRDGKIAAIFHIKSSLAFPELFTSTGVLGYGEAPKDYSLFSSSFTPALVGFGAGALFGFTPAVLGGALGIASSRLLKDKIGGKLILSEKEFLKKLGEKLVKSNVHGMTTAFAPKLFYANFIGYILALTSFSREFMFPSASDVKALKFGERDVRSPKKGWFTEVPRESSALFSLLTKPFPYVVPQALSLTLFPKAGPLSLLSFPAWALLSRLSKEKTGLTLGERLARYFPTEHLQQGSVDEAKFRRPGALHDFSGWYSTHIGLMGGPSVNPGLSYVDFYEGYYKVEPGILSYIRNDPIISRDAVLNRQDMSRVYDLFSRYNTTPLYKIFYSWRDLKGYSPGESYIWSLLAPGFLSFWLSKRIKEGVEAIGYLRRSKTLLRQSVSRADMARSLWGSSVVVGYGSVLPFAIGFGILQPTLMGLALAGIGAGGAKLLASSLKPHPILKKQRCLRCGQYKGITAICPHCGYVPGFYASPP